MMTWTCKFRGHSTDGCAVVSADDFKVAIFLLEKHLRTQHGLEITIKPADLIPMVTSARKVRVLSSGDY